MDEECWSFYHKDQSETSEKHSVVGLLLRPPPEPVQGAPTSGEPRKKGGMFLDLTKNNGSDPVQAKRADVTGDSTSDRA